ncbi:LysM peptidoglycan-binding domain-containing protein [Endozoicomonas sp. SM1973]|uniref:LysM peptidoglycan-binding domain-containing protein n=1 Tax=Spartinivicinus marinus TaxID=2994442 RepID=A0A853HYY9_9GAMM|nr:LysM peptidoglycan-binding domain-containing protein [Spartinivicinus marinus]MCX4029669.1 LysM peptidoglycan-binding domain-containing protein [Spartinivicinus marinus]NYZ66950.1 LysM peptidoglycan-binding domain-containing protein [Spartinivicinus marinus]
MNIALKYTILPNNTYKLLAKSFNECAGVSWKKIEQANPGISPKYLTPGQVISIPATTSDNIVLHYTILSGDTYYNISQRLAETANITAKAIEQANPGVTPTDLQVGQVINIPATNTGASTSSTQQPTSTKTVASTVGYYDWTWSPTSPTADANLGIAFSGWVDPQQALSDSNNVYNDLAGKKYISLGGGNDNGSWTNSSLSEVTSAINNSDFSQYDGIVYDIEVGDSGLETSFKQSFQAAKKNNLSVLVTVSHSAPYGISDASTLMQSFFNSNNIDILSPQLYTTGNETENDYAISQGVQWSQYAEAKPEIVVSIVKADMYQSAVQYFSKVNVNLKGYLVWAKSG